MKKIPSTYVSDMFKVCRPQSVGSFQIRLRVNTVNEHRVTVLVPKKYINKAHDRNLIKRRAKEALMRALFCKDKPKYDILVLGNTQSLERSFQDYVRDFSAFFGLL